MNETINSAAPEVLPNPVVKFTNMKDATAEDFRYVSQAFAAHAKGTAARVLQHMELLAQEESGFRVDRLTHSIQAAVLAMANRESDDYVVCALLHDIGDTLCSPNHSQVGAAIVQPFVNPGLAWMVRHHNLFQGYYFFHYIGRNRDLKFAFKSSPYFELTERFVDLYDAPSFDPEMKVPRLEFFRPMLETFFSREPRLEDKG